MELRFQGTVDRFPGWLQRLVAIGADPSDPDDLRVRKAVLVLSATLITSFAFIWVATYALLGLWVPAAIPLVYQVASATSIWIFARTRRYSLFRSSQLLMSLVFPFVLQWTLGGFEASSAVCLWGITSPLGALLFLGSRQSIPWFGAFIGLLTFSALIDPTLSASPADVPHAAVVAFFALNIAVYLPYATFAEWHYLRFLLPGLAAALPVGTTLLARRGTSPAMVATLVAATLLLGTWQLHIAARLDVFRLGPIERRYAIAADWVAGQTPSNAVIATAQQSGSIALNARRSVLRWDLVAPGHLDQAIQIVEASGRPVWLLVESWEQPALRSRHDGVFARLDWPPAASISAWVPVTIHRAADRARFLDGSHIPTTHIADRRR